MRLRVFAALLAITLFAWPAAAQEQRGSIEGVVKDSSGAVLPGATVEARSGGSGVLVATTDSTGSFRFPSVLPGTYEVTANLAGFKVGKVSNVDVRLGSVKSVEFSLQLATITEAVTVTAESPIVDVKSSGKSTNLRAEQVALLPHGRDFTTLVTQAPGVNYESKSSGVMIDGAAAAENRYVIDGIETTNIIGGLSGQNVLADFVEEVQVKSTGYPAEFGGSTGGVINVLTKSGTNNLHGNVLTFYQGSRLNGKNNQTLRPVLGHADQAEYHTYPKDKVDHTEPGASIGGPIMTNRMWYFGAYQPTYETTKRHVDSSTSGNTPSNASDTQNKDQVQYLTANTTNQFGNRLRTRVAFNNTWRKTEGSLAGLTGQDSRTTVYTKGTRFPNYSIAGTADYTVSPSFVVSGRVGRFLRDTHDFNVNNVVRYVFDTPNIGLAGVPENFQHDGGYANVPNNSGVDHDTQTRNYGQIDATWFGKAAGQHQVKGGVQIDRRGNDVVSGELKNLVNLNWTLDGTGCPYGHGPFGCYVVRANGPEPSAGFITQGNVKSNVYGVFVQDTWALNNRLTVNLGIRTESENVPAYATASDVPPNPIKFEWKDKTAPRVGFAYDLKGDGRSKIYGSWGIFYDIFKLNMPRGSFGGEKWISYYFSLDTPNFESISGPNGCVPSCPGTFFQSVDFRRPSVKPGQDVAPPGTIKPMRNQELSFGFERQLSPTLAATVRYVRKNLDRAIDDVGDLTPDGDELYIIANPGEGLVDVFDISTGTSVFRPQGFAPNPVLIAMPKAKRLYNSVEGRLEKRLSDRWLFVGSYTWSRDQGNYSGLSSSDEPGRDNPNNSRDYDYPAMSFDGSGKVIEGILDTDRTHQVKAQGLYLFKWGTSVGLNEFIASGLPLTRQVPIIPPDNYPIRYRGRGSDGRTPVFSQTDVFVQHGFKVGGGRELQLQLNVLNVFDQRTVTRKATTMRRTGGIPLGAGYYTEADFYAGRLNFDDLIAKAVAAGRMTLNPQFLMANDYQTPIAARVGVKFSF
ncbi:MAG TPA: TonB-dependent receptor [Vicinamibacterales bacterium]|nr:TonB-dependent receptor [Vicinamibacterales bacterium]